MTDEANGRSPEESQEALLSAANTVKRVGEGPGRCRASRPGGGEHGRRERDQGRRRVWTRRRPAGPTETLTPNAISDLVDAVPRKPGCLREGAKSYAKRVPRPTGAVFRSSKDLLALLSRNWPCGPTYTNAVVKAAMDVTSITPVVDAPRHVSSDASPRVWAVTRGSM